MSPPRNPRWTRGHQEGTETVPVFTADRSTKEEPSSVPAASPRLPRSTSPWPPGRHPQDHPGVPRPRATCLPGSRGSAPLPADIRQVGAGEPLRDVLTLVSRVLLSVTLAEPHAVWQYQRVPALSGLLLPAPGTSRSGLPPATPPCCDRTAVKVSHLHSNSSASRRTWIQAQCGEHPGGGGAATVTDRAGSRRRPRRPTRERPPYSAPCRAPGSTT